MSLPTKFYVTRNYRSAEEVLGFMVVADAEHTKAVQKKKDSADRWARGSKLGPIYCDNVPKTGFQIVTNVSRYSTSNVVWRVYHPDGFEFEITSDNFMDLIQTSTMHDGAIQEELFFTANRKLVSTKTKLFAKELEKQEETKQQTEVLSEIKEGDLFQVTHDEKNTTYQYCGKYHMIVMNKLKPLHSSDKSTRKDVILNTSSGEYFIRSKVSDYPIKIVGFKEVDREFVSEELNTTLRKPKTTTKYSYDMLSDYYHLVVCGNSKPFKRSDCTVEYTDIDPKDIRSSIDAYLAYTEHNGEVLRLFGSSKAYSGYYSGNKKSQCENWHTAEQLFGYPAILEENGNLNIPDVDLSKHTGFSGYRNESPFSGLHSSSSYSDPHKLKFITIPETIKFGMLKIGK